MMLLAVVTMTVAASEVALTVDAATPCLQKDTLARALAGRGLVLGAPGDGLDVRVSPAPGGLEVLALQKDRRFQRRVPAEPSACGAVERVVVALIESWANTAAPRVKPPPRAVTDGGTSTRLEEASAKAPDDAPSEGTEKQSPGSGRTDGGLNAAGNQQRAPPPRDIAQAPAATGSERTGAGSGAGQAAGRPPGNDIGLSAAGAGQTTRRPPEDAAGAATPSGDATSPRGSARDEPPPAATLPDGGSVESPPGLVADAGLDSPPPAAPDPGVASPIADAPSAPSFPFQFQLALLGGGTIDGSNRATGAGSALVRAAFGRWGLQVDVGLESARTGSREGVAVSASQQWLSAAFSVAFAPLEDLRLDVALGARGWRTEASATGVDVPNNQTAFTWGPLFAAGGAYRVTGPLFLTARASASWRTVELLLKVDPLGQVLALNPWIFGLQGGILVSFE